MNKRLAITLLVAVGTTVSLMSCGNKDESDKKGKVSLVIRKAN